MARMYRARFKDMPYDWLIFFCPGCKDYHHPSDRWEFNGNMDRPTLKPSVLVRYHDFEKKEAARCHSFVKDGRIQFLSDCTHSLKNQTVDLPELDMKHLASRFEI